MVSIASSLIFYGWKIINQQSRSYVGEKVDRMREHVIEDRSDEKAKENSLIQQLSHQLDKWIIVVLGHALQGSNHWRPSRLGKWETFPPTCRRAMRLR